MLPTMLAMAPHYPDYHLVIAGAPNQSDAFYNDFRQNAKEAFKGQIQLVANRTYEVVTFSESGHSHLCTATLETALFKVPEVVCYKEVPSRHGLPNGSLR